MSEREPCQQFVRQWPVGNGEWIDTAGKVCAYFPGKVCPRCGFVESEHPHAGEPSDESAPTFDAPKPVLRPNPWRVLEDALDAGIACGLNRADKHADDVLTDAQRWRVTTAVYEAVMLEMSERFMWDDEV